MEIIKQKAQTESAPIFQEIKNVYNLNINSIPWLFPVRNPISNYVGYEDQMKSLDENFKYKNNILVIAGIDGIGKTEFCIKYAYEYYEGKCYFLTFKGNFKNTFTDPSNIFIDESHQLYVNNPRNQELKKNYYIEIINKLKKGQNRLKDDDLLIIDNVTSFEDFEIIHNLPCKILITTNEFHEINYEKCAHFNLRQLNINECHQLFKLYSVSNIDEYKNPNINDDKLTKIFDKYGRHILCLQLIARLYSEGNINIDDFLRMPTISKFDNYNNVRSNENNNSLRKNILEHIQKILEETNLKRKNMIKLTKSLFILDINGISLNTITTINEEYKSVIECLKKYCIINIHNKNINVNNLYKQYFNEYILWKKSIRNVWNDWKTLRLLYKRFDKIFNEYIYSFNHDKKNYTTQHIHEYLQLCKNLIYYHKGFHYKKLGIKVVTKLAYILYITGYWNESVFYYKILVNYYNDIFDMGNEYMKGITLNNRLVAEGYIGAAKANKAIGNYKEAINLLNIAKSFSENFDDLICKCYMYSGMAYYQGQGDYQKALSLLEYAKNIAEKMYGKKHHLTGEIYDYLGLCYSSENNYELAIYLYNKAIEIRKENYGIDSWQYAETLNNLAGVYRKRKQNDDLSISKQMYIESLDKTAKILGENHPDLASKYNNLGLLYYDLEEYKESEKKFNKALKIYYNSLGGAHPYTSTCLTNKSKLLIAVKRYDEAEKLLVKAEQAKEKFYINTHPHLKNVYELFMILYINTKNETLYKKYWTKFNDSFKPHNC